jgi:hypothetical protein
MKSWNLLQHVQKTYTLPESVKWLKKDCLIVRGAEITTFYVEFVNSKIKLLMAPYNVNICAVCRFMEI